MGKKKTKYIKWLGDADYDARDVKLSAADYVYSQRLQDCNEENVPPQMLCSIRGSPGFFLGLPSGPGGGNYVGVPQGAEGNIVVVGGNGSGKSTGIAKPTLQTWTDAICATDIKGELTTFYEGLYRDGLATRPMIVFDPMQIDGPSYDPFDWLLQDDEAHLVSNIWEITLAILPILPNDNQPFWAETERGALAAALLHYFKCGLSFSEAVTIIVAQPLSTLCEQLTESDDVRVRFFLGGTATMKLETLANVDRGLRNKLMLYATDPYIGHAFRGRREGANCFAWDDLDAYNIFLRVPADKIEEWGGAINLMCTQLIRHLARRPEMYSPEGANNVQTLLLMDEFARFGKLEMITAAMATLRSKNVNICLMVQSVAQLDKVYGEYDRRIIFDNSQFQAILRASDADTQKYLAELIGTHICRQRSVSKHEDDFGDTTGYSKQLSEIRDLVVQPHELATLKDNLLLTPYGFCRVKKFQIYDENMKSKLITASKNICIKCTAEAASKDLNFRPTPGVIIRSVCVTPDNSRKNKGARIMSIEERTTNANKRIDAAERKHRQEELVAQEAQKRQDSRRNYIIGELVTRYFPSLREREPGTATENQTRFEPLEAFLYVLSTDYELVGELQDRAAQLVTEDPDGEWRSLI